MSLLKTNEIQNYNGSSLTLTASTVSTSAQLNTGGNISVTGSLNVSDDSTTRTNLGLGTIATQDSDSITVTGGTATLGALTVSGSDSGDLVRITQTGSGNALVVEDSSNPDSTPFIINANGEVYVGTTTGTINSSNFGTSIGASLKHSRNTATSAVVQFFGTAGECRILGDGDVLNTNDSYGAISDIKLKENIVDAAPKLSNICNIRIVNYNLKKNPKQKLLGVIAQEVETIFPGIVSEIIDEDDEGNDLGTTTKYVKTSVFIFMLIKAIQEQQTLIESQQSQIDALIARIEALETT